MLRITSKNLITVLAAGAATAATFVATPASAFLVRFCGVFYDPTGTAPVVGSSIDGTIDVSSDGQSVLDFFAKTVLPGGPFPEEREYSLVDYIGGPPATVAIDPFQGNPAYTAFQYRFGYSSPGNPLNYLLINLDSSNFPLDPLVGYPFGLVTMEEYRDGIRRKDPDKANVPGPLPIFGAAAAFGMSRRLRKRISEHQPQA